MNKRLNKLDILKYLKEIKPIYEKEGFILKGLFGSYARDESTKNSDIDILVETTSQFASKYGFQSVNRINEIKQELTNVFETDVDLADSSGMGQTAKKFIIDRTIYV